MFLEIIFMVVPLILGSFQIFAKTEGIYDFTENLHAWFVGKKAKILSGEGKFSKFTNFSLLSIYSLFIAIHDITRSARDIWIRSGIRIAAYLYLLVFFIVLLLTIGYLILIFALLALIISAIVQISKARSHVNNFSGTEQTQTFVTKYYPFFISQAKREEVGGLFSTGNIEVDCGGNVYAKTRNGKQSSGKVQVGFVNRNGIIYDVRKSKPQRIGTIDAFGNVIGKYQLLSE